MFVKINIYTQSIYLDYIEKNSKLWNTPNLIITPHVSSDDHGNYVKLTLDIFIKNYLENSLSLFMFSFYGKREKINKKSWWR